VETRAGALGSGQVSISNGAIWKVTTTAQNQNGSLSIGTGGWRDSDRYRSFRNGCQWRWTSHQVGAGTLDLRGGGIGIEESTLRRGS
jgi:hypothetical protein